MSLQSKLEALGYFVPALVANGRAAIDAAFEHHPDLVLMDVRLQGELDGIQAAQIIRDRFDLPVVYLTAYSNKEIVERAKITEPYGYILKPYTDRELQVVVEIALYRHKSQQERLEQLMEKHANLRAISLLAAIVESSQDAIIGFSADGIITTWNAAAQGLFGYSAAEAIGSHASMLAPPDGEAQMNDMIRRIASGDSVTPYETVRRRKDGSLVEVSVALSAVLDDAARPIGYSSFVRDISQLRQLQEQYRHAQKMEAVGLLAGGVAHDFNNILTVIGGYAKLLLDEQTTDRQRDLLSEIREAGERASTLTRQLLAFSRRQLLAPDVLDLNDIVANSARMLKRLIGQDIDINTRLTKPLDRILADAGQLEQALMNLAVNGRDAMPTGGHLSIVTDHVVFESEDGGIAAGSYVRLIVSDTGCGMTEEVRAKIFEPFFTTKGVGRGTGLGLAMVYGIVKQSHGHITVESAPGRGTTFTILFPRTDKPLARASLPNPDSRARAQRGETVLLVEDDPSVRRFTSRYLTGIGYRVLEASNGPDSLAIAARHEGPIHILLTDVVLPQMSGRELADAFLARRPEGRVLFVSGHLDDTLIRHGVDGKTSNFLQKPFTSQSLAQAIQNALEPRP